MKRFFTLILLSASILNAFALRLIVLSDVHVTPGNQCDKELRVAVQEINQTPCDAVILSGDLSNEGSDEQLKNVKSIVDNIKYPFFVIPGNHENNWSQSATKTFIDLWGNDRFYYEVPGTEYVIVGTNCGPYMKMGDGHVKKEDLHWLKSILDKYKGTDKKIISFNHYPLRKNDLDLGYIDYIKLLEQYPTIIHINGHYHTYKPYMSGSIQSMMVGALDQGNGNYGYTYVDVDNDSIRISRKLIGKDSEVIETFPVKMPEITAFEDVVGNDYKYAVKVWADSASVFTRVGFTQKNIIFGNSLGEVKAVDKKTNKVSWKINTGASMFSRVQCYKNIVAVPSANKELLFVNDKDGRIMDKISSVGPYVADGLSVNNFLYQGGYKKFEKFDISSHKLIWKYDSINNYCQAAPVVDGNDVIFGAWDTYLRCLDARTGELKWKWNNGKSANMLGPGNVVPVVTKDRVYVVAPDRYMTAIDRFTGKTIWRNNEHKYRESLGHSEDYTKIYSKTMDGELAVVDAASDEFKLIKLIDLKIGYEHAPCIVLEKNGIVYVGSRRGIITAVDAKTYDILWQITVGSSEINGFDVDPYTGKVYVSLIEGTIFRL
ncbi:MAG: PQQ-binding-like beta-propeller repeat protein [Bacteroidales bacterium]|nr:PQQ-binding-like beta-propeller repeat protein [Bacteroidales bacterium]